MPKPKHKILHKRRNAAPFASAPRRRVIRRAPPPDFYTTIASVAGGGGGAVVGGFLAREDIMDPETVGLAMTVGGAVAAYTLEGNMRVAANGIAAAGAGQLALAMMAKRDSAKAAADATKAAATAATKREPEPSPPNGEPPRQGYGPARVFNRYSSTAANVRNQQAYIDELDDADLEAAYAD